MQKLYDEEKKEDKVGESINVQAAFIMQFFSFVKVKS